MYYAPHHGIYRQEKLTTKLREFFYCSARTTNGRLLNVLLYNGLVIQNDLFTIMISFREHVYTLTADVKKIYRMINVDTSQHSLQRVLCKHNFEEEHLNYKIKYMELSVRPI